MISFLPPYLLLLFFPFPCATQSTYILHHPYNHNVRHHIHTFILKRQLRQPPRQPRKQHPTRRKYLEPNHHLVDRRLHQAMHHPHADIRPGGVLGVVAIIACAY